jgi:hypothetical protein
MTNKGILAIIAVAVVAILAVMVFRQGTVDRRTSVEKAADAVGEAAEEIGDEIDDHTTKPNTP